MSSRSEALSHAAGSDWGRLTGTASLEEFASAWLAVAGAGVGADRGVLVVRRAETERYAPVAFFPEGEPCGPFLADAAERALYEARPLAIEDAPRLGIACPAWAQGRLEAIAAFEWSRAPEEPREATIRAVQWGIPWIEARLGAASSPGNGQASSFGSTVLPRVLAAKGYVDAARAAATELAHWFSLERVSVGYAEAGRVHLAAISNTAQFDSRLELPRAIEAIMRDAQGQAKTVRQPGPQGESSALGMLAGQSLFCLEQATPFEDPVAGQIEQACAALAPALDLQRANERPWHQRVLRVARAQIAALSGPRATRRRAVATAALVAIAVLVFAKGEFRVAADAALEGSVRRVLSAPFDGYVAASIARAGDRVARGAPVAELDDRDLRLERLRWAGQRAQYERQMQEASAKHERGQMQITAAQVDQADAQMKLLDEQLRRARIVAPFDGLIVSGDLSQSVGSAVKKGETLFEVTPLAGFRVVIFVDESEIDYIAAGQKGSVLLTAISGRSFPIAVTLVTPVARVKDGRNTFRVEASLQGPIDRLRPGMEGVAKIDTGPRNLVWIWTHRFTNWLRLKVWSFWP